jgi:hypothetical protein
MPSLDARLHASQWATQPTETWVEDLHPEVFPATYRRFSTEGQTVLRLRILAAMRALHAALEPGFARLSEEVDVEGDPGRALAQAYLEGAEIGIAALAHLLADLAGAELVRDRLGPDLPSAEELLWSAGRAGAGTFDEAS